MTDKPDRKPRQWAAVALPLAVLAVLFVTRWSTVPATVHVDSGRLMMLGTFGRIQVRCASQAEGQAAIEAGLAAIAAVDQRLSIYRPDSELSAVNKNAAAEPVRVSPETRAILLRAWNFCELSGGAFDITVGPLLAVWRAAAAAGRMPTDEELAAARGLVGYRQVELSQQAPWMVSLAQPGVSVNLNAIAKGYAVDAALAAVRETGVAAALVEIGGDLACFGGAGQERPWTVGVQDPFAAGDEDLLQGTVRWVLTLTEGALATSGNYRQYVEIDGRRFSHIVDPRTAWPADAVPSVTILAANAADADALATVVSVMGVDEGLALVESLPGVEALLVAGSAAAPQVHRSSGLAHYEKRR